MPIRVQGTESDWLAGYVQSIRICLNILAAALKRGAPVMSKNLRWNRLDLVLLATTMAAGLAGCETADWVYNGFSKTPRSIDASKLEKISQIGIEADRIEQVLLASHVEGAGTKSSINTTPLVSNGKILPQDQLKRYISLRYYQVDNLCEFYFSELHKASINSQFWRNQGNTLASATTAALGLAQVASSTLGYLALSQTAVNATFDNVGDTLLISPSPIKTMELVVAKMIKFRSDNAAKLDDPKDYPGAAGLVQSYASLCTPKGVKGILEEAIAQQQILVEKPGQAALSAQVTTITLTEIAAEAGAPAPSLTMAAAFYKAFVLGEDVATVKRSVPESLHKSLDVVAKDQAKREKVVQRLTALTTILDLKKEADALTPLKQATTVSSLPATVMPPADKGELSPEGSEDKADPNKKAASRAVPPIRPEQRFQHIAFDPQRGLRDRVARLGIELEIPDITLRQAAAVYLALSTEAAASRDAIRRALPARLHGSFAPQDGIPPARPRRVVDALQVLATHAEFAAAVQALLAE